MIVGYHFNYFSGGIDSNHTIFEVEHKITE